jgi:hypothetical protein
MAQWGAVQKKRSPTNNKKTTKHHHPCCGEAKHHHNYHQDMIRYMWCEDLESVSLGHGQSHFSWCAVLSSAPLQLKLPLSALSCDLCVSWQPQLCPHVP